jgi:DeoR/GlpR family transcriptional regulator of sugar metabolism
MLAAVRKNEIKNILLERKIVTVIELAKHFNVAEETVRRDLKSLEADGVVDRTHGGAVLKDKVTTSFNRVLMKNIMQESKRIMASLARPLINNGLCLFMDSSTTVLSLINEIRDLQLTLVTNSLDILTECSVLPNIRLVSLGGTLNLDRRCFTGSLSCKALENLYFDMAIISCRHLSVDQGITDSDSEEAEIKRQAVLRSKKLVVMADYTKFDKVSFVKICGIDKLDVLITDRPVDRTWKQQLEKDNVECIIPKGDEKSLEEL